MLTKFFILCQKERWAALWLGCATVWNSISFSNIFLFFRGILKLITYIILLLHETNQRPLCVLGRGVAKLTGWFGIKFQQCHCECTALFVYISATGYHMVISD